MIDKDIIENVIDVIELQSVIYVDREIDGYEYGSYYIPEEIRPSVSYLELYKFVLSHVLDILNYSLDYTDFGFTDNDITTVINNVNELTFYYD